ncbi:MAG: SpoIIE family protein phosphatase [Anaerolineae bacterium]|nr:SpoIIE family protein phosphatase [Anaerolineae bacterium]
MTVKNVDAATTPPLDFTSLAKHKLFRDLPLSLIEILLTECPARTLAPGEVLIAPKQENHQLYLVMSGCLQVSLDTADSTIGFSIEAGECIGEMSIIEERRTSAYVIAEEACHLLVLTEEIFWNKLMREPAAVRNMLKMLSKRMRNHNEVTLQTLEQQLRYEHLQKELEAAGKIQANILPKKMPLFPNHPQVDVFATMEPAKEVGGDFFDAFALDNDNIYIAIGDVSGKGMPAALFMVRVITLLRMGISDEAAFGAVLPMVNRMLCQNNEDCMFVSLFIGLLNVTTGRLTYMNGGHNRPFFARSGDAFELLDVPRSLVLGLRENMIYDVAELVLKPGDTLVLYTDGVTEAENPERDFFEVEGAAAVLNQCAKKDMTSMVEALKTAVTDFSAGAPQSDDITLLALRYQGID